MTEDPYVEIDDYLKLVRSHLPNEIADEIIHEIRTYLVELAQELGHGQVSIESARRSIARFGAPSEIAQEYSRSILDVEDHVADEKPGYEKYSPESVWVLMKNFPRQIRNAFALFLIWFVFFVLVIVLVAYTIASPYVIYQQIFVDAILIVPLFLAVMLVYFLYRLLWVKVIGSSSVFGKRGGIEIVFDFLASFVAMIIVAPGGAAIYQTYLWHYGVDGALLMMQLLGLTSVIMVFFILIRLFGDLLALARPKDRVRAIKTLMLSGFVLSLGLAVMIGAAIPVSESYYQSLSHHGFSLIIAFFLAFQASTSLVKLVEIHRETSLSRRALANYRQRGGES